MPGTGMKVPMRYTTSAPIRNSSRLRISPRRPVSANAAAGFEKAELSTSVLYLAAGRFNSGPRALGEAQALEGHGLLEFARQHDLGALGGLRHDAGALERGQVDHRRF